MGRSPSRAVATDTGTAGPIGFAAGSAEAGCRVAEVACSPYPTPARRTTARSHGQRRRPSRARVIGSMFMAPPCRSAGCAPSGAERGDGIVGILTAHSAENGCAVARSGERRLRVGELDDVADARPIAAFGNLEVLPRLLEPLVRDPDALDGLAQVERRLPHVERDVLARDLLVGLRFSRLALASPTWAVVRPPLKT